MLNCLVVDLSHHNTVTSFERLYAAGVRGVIHKATQGINDVDPTYKERRQAALNAGLLWGAYHFADCSDAVAQVRHFLTVAAPDDNTLMALDYEPYGSATMSIGQARTFIEHLDLLIKRKTVLYSGNLIKETLKDDPDGWWSSHPLWLAEYGPHMYLPNAWKQAFLWQYSDGKINVQGDVDGVTGEVDRNAYLGNDLNADWVRKQDVPAPAPEEPQPPPVQNQTTIPDTSIPWWQRLFSKLF